MLTPIPTLTDNYIWLYRCNHFPALLVDIGDFSTLSNYLAQNPTPIEAVLLTHHHSDHTGGVIEFHQAYPDVPIYGSAECTAVITNPISEGEIITPHYHIDVLATPGHTTKHLSYFVNKHLFCGDTLFSAGCGRVFNHDYEAMFASLQKIKTLPDDTQICCAHEYTLSNLEFAMTIVQTQFQKEMIATNIGIVKFLMASNMPTLPTTLSAEKQFNPFLQAKNVDEFRQLRQKKDNF